MRSAGAYAQMVDAYRAALLRAALVNARGNKTTAARALGLTRNHFYRLLSQFGVATTVVERRRAARAG